MSGILALMAASLWFFAPVDPIATDNRPPVSIDSQRLDSERDITAAVQLTDEQLQATADQLLALVDPERPENDYFSDFARDRLRWMVREHGAGRLDVAFLTDTSAGLPTDVLMAASKLHGRPTIFIAKPRFMKFLIETGATAPPFTAEQKNDFALALVHEVVHLQNPDADPGNIDLRAAEESRVWRELSLQVVRPLRAQNQPIHHRFRDVDDALRVCRDELPCAPLLRLVRTNP